MEKQGINAMEFQLGSETSATHNQSLFQNEKFPQETWVTQGKITVFSEEACPVPGEYTGVTPVLVIYNNPQRMFYSVYNCHKSQ